MTPENLLFLKHTDFISDWQYVRSWGFDFQVLQDSYNTCDYSLSVRRALFMALKKIASSRSSRVRDRHFTIWMGDSGPENQYFWVAVPYRMLRSVVDIFDRVFSSQDGFMFEGNGDQIPYLPLIPVYRYEYGRVVEYADFSEAGRMRIDDEEDGFGTGLVVVKRARESAEGFEVRQHYCG